MYNERIHIPKLFFINEHFHFFISGIVVTRQKLAHFMEWLLFPLVLICHQFFLLPAPEQLPLALMEMKMAKSYNVVLPRNLMNAKNAKMLLTFELLTSDMFRTAQWFVNLQISSKSHVLFSWSILEECLVATNFQSDRINSVIKLGIFRRFFIDKFFHHWLILRQLMLKSKSIRFSLCISNLFADFAISDDSEWNEHFWSENIWRGKNVF